MMDICQQTFLAQPRFFRVVSAVVSSGDDNRLAGVQD